MSLFVLGITSYSLLNCCIKKKSPEVVIEQRLVTEIDSFSTFVDTELLPVAESPQPDSRRLQQLFLQARLLYKRFEWAAEYFTPNATRTVNGPPVPEVELSGQVKPPGGLQVIEAYLFPVYDPAKRTELIGQLKQLTASCVIYQLYYKHIPVLDWQIWAAAKQQVYRVLTLGITGFDDPLSMRSMQESACSLDGVRDALILYPIKVPDSLFNAASLYLKENPNFNSFDRAAFISHYGNPLTTGLAKTEKHLNLHGLHYGRLLRQNASTMFDTDAFNSMVYAVNPNSQDSNTVVKIALGRKLFNDPLLSGTRTRSCASCHNPNNAFTDGLSKNTSLTGRNLINRHTPTLLNAAFQPAQFADLRVSTLEEQVQDVIENANEMRSSLKQVCDRLQKNRMYLKLFSATYGVNQEYITPTEVTEAISTYVRSLSKLDSRFDCYMRGNADAMSLEELKGFNLFMGKARCGTCHYMPLFNGALPPLYEKMDAEVIGIPASRNTRIVDPDRGRYLIVRADPLDHAFKTPTVRNAARTAPYMHNGIFDSLEEVINFYNNGGGKGTAMKINNQTLSMVPLKLSTEEQHELIAFIKSLNSRL